jgi:hypothetical protein
VSLANKPDSVSEKHRGRPCLTCQLLGGLAKRDRDALVAALDDSGLTTAAIVRVLHSEGYEVGYNAVRRHRLGGCLTGESGRQTG